MRAILGLFWVLEDIGPCEGNIGPLLGVGLFWGYFGCWGIWSHTRV